LKDLSVLPPIDDFSASNASHRFASLKRLQADYPKIGRKVFCWRHVDRPENPRPDQFDAGGGAD